MRKAIVVMEWQFDEGDPIAEGLLAWKCLGRGERCETWLAWSVSRCAPVVAKMLRPRDLDDTASVSALRREAGLLAKASHPFLPRLYDDFTSTSRPHLVMEYVEGPSLAHIVEHEGTFTSTDTMTIGLQILMALHHLHQMGIAHLDIKPGNVVMRNRRIVLIDLGGSRILGTPTPSGPVWGTDGYLAPEYEARGPATVAADIFALGATMAELWSGDPALSRRRRFLALKGLRGSRLDRVISVLTSHDPALRPATALEAMALARTVRPGFEPPWPVFVEPVTVRRVDKRQQPDHGTGVTVTDAVERPDRSAAFAAVRPCAGDGHEPDRRQLTADVVSRPGADRLLRSDLPPAH